MHDNFLYNPDLSRYELHQDGHTAYANVRRADGVLYIDYVEAPPALRGTGAAGNLMRALMDQVKGEGVISTVQPVCGYAASWLQKHKEEYADIL